MKRMALSLLCCLCGIGICAPQNRMRAFVQEGIATAELESDQLDIAHPSLPLGTKLRVTNLSNNREVMVTVTTRLGSTSGRIADLSTWAAWELGLGQDAFAIVKLEAVSPPPAPAPDHTASPEQAAPPPPEAASSEAARQLGGEKEMMTRFVKDVSWTLNKSMTFSRSKAPSISPYKFPAQCSILAI
jgi:rare lipoprotein A